MTRAEAILEAAALIEEYVVPHHDPSFTGSFCFDFHRGVFQRDRVSHGESKKELQAQVDRAHRRALA